MNYEDPGLPHRIHDVLYAAGWPQANYHPAGLGGLIAIRVIDARFSGLLSEDRESLLKPALDRIDLVDQGAIAQVLCVAPEEIYTSVLNLEFEKYAGPIRGNRHTMIDVHLPLLAALRAVAADDRFWQLDIKTKLAVQDALRPHPERNHV